MRQSATVKVTKYNLAFGMRFSIGIPLFNITNPFYYDEERECRL